MKRSRLVSLTLLTPAMLAFGCGQQPPPPMRPVARVANPNDGEPVQCDVPAKPGEPAKQPCPPGQATGAQGATTNRSHSTYFHRPIYRPSYLPSGSDSTSDTSSVRSTSPSSSGSTRSTFGGFGSSGSRMSGGS
jgi:hypothetical protein